MTQSYSTPLYYSLVRESDTFNEVEDVQTSEVVLVAYANEDYYLNVPHTFDPKDGEYHEENLSFQNTKDYNAWFMVEYNEEKEIVHLKHFNTGKYVSIENGDGVEDIARLVEEKNEEDVEESSIVFEPINSDNTNVTRFTNEIVFKIRASNRGTDDEDNYIRFANEEDKEAVDNEENNQNIFDDSDLTTVPLVVRDADPINKYDTFKLIFPTDDTYRELVFCKDSYLRLQDIYRKIHEAETVIDGLEDTSFATYKSFLKIYKFVTNDLEGRTNADYDVDEIINYRQEMVAKAGILSLIFKFLELCVETNNDKDEEEWGKELQHVLRIPKSENNDFDNVIELVFETMYSLFEGNNNNQLAASLKINIMQQFVFVPNITKVLIIIFKDKQFEMNKKEIHTEILYRRIFEFDRFQPIVSSFVDKLKHTNNDQYLFILRKICMIDGNPLPLIQKEIFQLIFNQIEAGESWDESDLDEMVFGVSFGRDNILELRNPRNIDNEGISATIFATNFETDLQPNEINFVLDQLALEADL